ncbi:MULTISPECIES: sigma-54 dependent transcriptional regulator [unclassified Fusibacter]|uniref:sigma-54-dependent transcriptional regulator n=1 Tax=unclassified Fusibacter TaxID=2624464 RepID=UPI0010107460|nr:MULTISPECIES: sigma-54 dependent transcriptional regulator [unclassified Fusibacter]MCK8059176.1 sigma-54 dependent transcriptional regulator [Fusibacter sp. A2]NPE22585.1 sigma-54-dependent Fis family transcriptional regulator [Fusibacter sp. A1]RXV60686.1 sigma-54-dependent Fis family transcriptional regulator [Fusibacter sp. A1]
MSKIRILVVEDELHLRDLVVKVLKNEDYHVESSKDAEDALQLLEDTSFDIVITDLRLPGISGIELLKKIKQVDKDIVVILMTAFATVETAIGAIRMGAFDYIRKPFDINELTAAVYKAKLLLEASSPSMIYSEDIPNILVSHSEPMKEVIGLIKKVAASMATVYINGETGVGKELVANAIHASSNRYDKPFIKVNCSAFPETLLESELFGYEKGAFTGAFARKLGRFELANTGTIFLDEIGDISPLIQLKLLRIIQQKEFERLGGTETIALDVRIITATNKDLEVMVKEGSFREDLYYRLNVIPLHMPSLRERQDDFETLVQTFLVHISNFYGTPIKSIQPKAMELLKSYNWPGNVRELENIIERLVVISEGQVIGITDLPDKITQSTTPVQPTILLDAKDSIEEHTIKNALNQTNGNITKAASLLGISRRSLHRKLNKYELNQE